MGWNIKKTDKGTWIWNVWFSSHGLGMGEKNTLAEAKVEVAIAQASLLDSPFPETVKKVMREDPEKFAKDYPDPEEIGEV